MVVFLFLDLPIGCSAINTTEVNTTEVNKPLIEIGAPISPPNQPIERPQNQNNAYLKFQKIILPKKVLNHGSYPSDIHDKCYITPGMSQNSCDQLFLANMREKCKMPGAAIFAYPICVTVAKIAVEVVASIDQGPELKIICYGTSL